MNVVLTVSTCDRCDDRHTEDGANGTFPPVGWSSVSLSTRAPGSGWSGGGQRLERMLCRSCTAFVHDRLMGRPSKSDIEAALSAYGLAVRDRACHPLHAAGAIIDGLNAAVIEARAEVLRLAGGAP